MNKGIVMDIKKHSVVVLTPDGEFITFKRKSHSYMIGEEISFNEQEQRVPRFSIPSFLKPASLLVACFLCVFLFFYNQPEEKALAYVSVDINPSLEASVTKDLRVIDLRACNDDGKRILKEMKRWKNEPLQDVVRTIVKQSQEDGYLTNDKQVMLTAVTKEKSLEPQLEKAMQGLKKEYETKHVTVVYQGSTMQVRENAKKAGVGTGVYIKQENEKKKSLTPPAPPSNQEEHPQEIHSQPESSPDASSDLSPVKEERYEEQEQIEQKQSQEQQPQQSKGNNGHQQENNGKEYKPEYKQENKEYKPEYKPEYKQENKEYKPENKEYKQENKEYKPENKEYKQENKEYKPENKEYKQENKGNINENNGHKKEDKNVPATQHQGKEKKNP
ncbi:anti-sigma factor domain-containing protein [Bacillus sp. DX4.1]|uniref:anti-sigma factor domain-containing protein n=1 Tax=Bacillus sp. DX4.1 TaxID=3055867 RepID=UPI0025A1ADDA|nr:anti-sigma factor domain-containing protein [Bacillus sp. DX4.1]MDM5186202.1 anti-sigma factor domain-containing protein [Bacillus sp. DX4.1]